MVERNRILRLYLARMSSVMNALARGDVPKLEEACQLDRFVLTEHDGEIRIPADVVPEPELVDQLRAQACDILYSAVGLMDENDLDAFEEDEKDIDPELPRIV